MEDERYQHRKQYVPDFIGSGASASAPSSEGGTANERLDNLDKKNSRNQVARNLDGTGNGGFFASLGGGDVPNVPEAVLEHL